MTGVQTCALPIFYAKAFGVPLGELIGAAVEDATPSGVGIRVIGEAAVGVWRDPSLSQTSDKTITVPDDHPISRFALKIVDQSINKVIGQGEYAVCEPVDVTEIEPVEPTNPLLKMGNVVITPHTASVSDLAGAERDHEGRQGELDVADRAAQVLRDHRQGRQVHVDRQRREGRQQGQQHEQRRFQGRPAGDRNWGDGGIHSGRGCTANSLEGPML